MFDSIVGVDSHTPCVSWGFFSLFEVGGGSQELASVEFDVRVSVVDVHPPYTYDTDLPRVCSRHLCLLFRLLWLVKSLEVVYMVTIDEVRTNRLLYRLKSSFGGRRLIYCCRCVSLVLGMCFTCHQGCTSLLFCFLRYFFGEFSGLTEITFYSLRDRTAARFGRKHSQAAGTTMSFFRRRKTRPARQNDR